MNERRSVWPGYRMRGRREARRRHANGCSHWLHINHSVFPFHTQLNEVKFSVFYLD